MSLLAFANSSLLLAGGHTMTTADLVSEPSLPPVPAFRPARTNPFFDMERPSSAIWWQVKLLNVVDDIFSDDRAELEVQKRTIPRTAKTKMRIWPLHA